MVYLADVVISTSQWDRGCDTSNAATFTNNPDHMYGPGSSEVLGPASGDVSQYCVTAHVVWILPKQSIKDALSERCHAVVVEISARVT